MFLVTIVFLMVAIGVTVQVTTGTEEPAEDLTGEFTGVPGAVISETKSSEALDREANLEKLREKLARGEGEISQGPPVLTSVDVPSTTVVEETIEENPDAVLDEEIVFSGRSQRFCPAVGDTRALAAGWLDQTFTSGQLLATVEEVTLVGSSTATTTAQKVVFTLPATPVRGLSSHCLDDQVIGVTPSGSLLTNGDAVQFSALTSNILVGYARDGFPIYGAGVDENLLDSCGGYDTGAGYQYHLRQDESFVLGCFAATPAPFTP